jgi:hypothetical protein
MMGFVFRLIPPQPDFVSRMSDDERATMTSHFAYWASSWRRAGWRQWGR